jgi:hypothetical protein
MNAGGEGNWERNPLGLSMDVAALKDHYSLLSPLRIGSSAVACRLAGSTYGSLEARKSHPVVTLLPQKSNATLTVYGELQEAVFQSSAA